VFGGGLKIRRLQVEDLGRDIGDLGRYHVLSILRVAGSNLLCSV